MCIRDRFNSLQKCCGQAADSESSFSSCFPASPAHRSRGYGSIKSAVTGEIDRQNCDNGRQDADARVAAPSRAVGQPVYDATVRRLQNSSPKPVSRGLARFARPSALRGALGHALSARDHATRREVLAHRVVTLALVSARRNCATQVDILYTKKSIPISKDHFI